MSLRTARSLTLASLVAVGIGCNAENPDGTPTKLGTVEKKIEGLRYAVTEYGRADATGTVPARGAR